MVRKIVRDFLYFTVVAIVFAMLVMSVPGCAAGYVHKPDGTVIFVGSVAKDTQVGDVTSKTTKDGSEFSLKGYDGKSKIEAAKALIDSLK
jgi:hypothetical protein